MINRTTIRPALMAKLQEYLDRRKEFEQFKNLDHPYLQAAFEEGWISAFGEQTNEHADRCFNAWRIRFAKEEREKNKRSRSQAPPPA